MRASQTALFLSGTIPFPPSHRQETYIHVSVSGAMLLFLSTTCSGIMLWAIAHSCRVDIFPATCLARTGKDSILIAISTLSVENVGCLPQFLPTTPTFPRVSLP